MSPQSVWPGVMHGQPGGTPRSSSPGVRFERAMSASNVRLAALRNPLGGIAVETIGPLWVAADRMPCRR